MPALVPFDRIITQRGTPATLFGPDGVSAPVPIKIIVSNARMVPMVGIRGDVIQAHVASGVAIAPGQVLQIPSVPSVWYVVAKALQVSRGVLFDPGTSMALLALPLLVTLKDKVTTKPAPQFLNARDEPRYRTAAGGVAGIPTTTTTFRAGMSNAFNALSLQLEGALPNSLTTYYCPLGQSLALDDEVLLPDGSPARVTRLYYKDADGVPYAREFVATGSVGTAL